MKYTEEEIETIAKSMYKAVKKALGTATMGEAKEKARKKSGKGVVEDVLDPNYVAESKRKSPPKRTAIMGKSETGVTKLKRFLKNQHKS